MSYCRFTNTLADLQDCREHLDDPVEELGLGEEERQARIRLIVLCRIIGDEYGDEID